MGRSQQPYLRRAQKRGQHHLDAVRAKIKGLQSIAMWDHKISQRLA